jgi:PKD repeat protein
LSRPASRLALTLAACIALIALAAPVASAAPDPSFSVDPSPPLHGQAATYTSTSTVDVGVTVAKVEWDFNRDGVFEVVDDAEPFTATHTYATPGQQQFDMRVTDSALVLPGVTTETQTVDVANRRPNADFHFGPEPSDPGQTVFFSSDSGDPDGDALSYEWDFGDGSPDDTRANPTHSYSTPGTKTVRLKVTDAFGASDEVTDQIHVRDLSAATASFTIEPKEPAAGQTVTFTSTSKPSSGQSITAQDWDLDSDGRYDDAHGRTASRAFAEPGVYRIALRVRQANGNDAVAEGTIRIDSVPVAAPFNSVDQTTPTPPPASKPKRKSARPSALTPFPKVRLKGEAYAYTTLIEVLAVRAPRGTLARVRCEGRGCPKTTRRKRAKGKPLRFYAFEKAIPVGARLEISIVGKGRIGKFVRFKLRSRKGPVRTNLCLMPGKSKPQRCPSYLHLPRK